MLKKIKKLFSKNEMKKLLGITVFSIIISLSEVVGLSTIVPFMAMVTNQNIIFKNKYLNLMYKIFDLIINSIEILDTEESIINNTLREKIKKGCLVVDAAGDPGRAIEGIRLSTWQEPIYEKKGVFYYSIDNLPTLGYRDISENISKIFSDLIY